MTLGELRRAAGYNSADSAALAMACSRIHLAEIERGAAGPGPKLREKMLAAYKCSASDLDKAVAQARLSWLSREAERRAQENPLPE